MIGIDAALDYIRDLERDFERALTQKHNEAQTRLHIIDRLIFDVCGWPRDSPEVATVEERVSPDGKNEWMDYWLRGRDGSACVVVEAKRAEKPFRLDGAKHGVRKYKNISPAPARQALDQALGYALRRGAELIAATNGNSWLFMRPFVSGIPQDELRVVVFPTLAEVREHISEFLRLISVPSVTRREFIDLFERINRAHTPFAARLTSRWGDRGIREHDFAGGVRQLMRELFGDITADRKMLDYCYVEDPRSRVHGRTLSATLKARMPSFLDEAGAMDATADNLSPTISEMAPANGSLLLVVGNVGAGKSTFLARHLSESIGDPVARGVDNSEDASTRSQGLHSKFVIARVDFNTVTASSGLSFSEESLTQTVAGRLLDELHERAVAMRRWRSDPYDGRNLRGVCTDAIQQAKQRFIAAWAREPSEEEFAGQAHKAIEEYVADKKRMLLGYAKFLKGSLKLPLVLVLDNVDQQNEVLEKFIYTFGVEMSEAQNCVCVVALREDTYYRQRVAGFLSTRNDPTFFVHPPRLARIVSKRLAYGREFVLADPRRLGRIDRSTPYPVSQIVDFVELLSEMFLREDEKSLELIEALSHRSVREAFRIVEEAFLSGHFDVSKLIMDYNRGQLRGVYARLLRALLLVNNRFYHEEQSRVKNVFSTSPAVRGHHFIRLRLLQRALHGRESENVPRFRGHWLVDEIACCGFSFQEVQDAFTQLVEWKALIPSRAPAEAREAPDDEYELSPWGVYLTSLVFERNYLRWVADDTVFYSRKYFDQYMRARGSKNTKVKRRALRVFCDYLRMEEARSFESRPQLSMQRWVVSFSSQTEGIKG